MSNNETFTTKPIAQSPQKEGKSFRSKNWANTVTDLLLKILKKNSSRFNSDIFKLGETPKLVLRDKKLSTKIKKKLKLWNLSGYGLQNSANQIFQ